MSTKPLAREDISTGALFSHRPTPTPEEVFLSVVRTVDYENAFKTKWGSRAAPHYLLSIDKEGTPRQSNRKTPCFLVAKAPNDPRPKDFLDAYRRCFEDESLRRDDIKPGTFFKHPGENRTFLAIDKNANTKFFYSEQQKAFFENVFSEPVIPENKLPCLDVNCKIFLTDKAAIVVPVDVESPQVKEDLLDRFNRTLFDLHRAYCGPQNRAGPDWVKVTFGPWSAKDVLKSLDTIKATDQVVSFDSLNGINKPALLEAVHRAEHRRAFLEISVVKDPADHADPAITVDAVDHLYQDQLDYFKREKERALKAVSERQALETPKVEHRQNDFRGQDERRETIASLKSKRSHLFTLESLSAEKIQFLDRYGWGDVSREEEKNLRESIAEFKAFLKQWNKKYKIKK